MHYLSQTIALDSTQLPPDRPLLSFVRGNRSLVWSLDEPSRHLPGAEVELEALSADTLLEDAHQLNLVGWGKAAAIRLTGPERYSRGQRWWKQFAEQVVEQQIDPTAAGPGAGPVAFSSFAFSADPGNSVMIVPQVLVGRQGKRQWLTVVGTTAEPPDLAAALADLALPPLPREPLSQPIHLADGTRTAADWQRTVAQAVDRIEAGELDKVVLARDVFAQAVSQIDVPQVLRTLSQQYPNCWVFSVDGHLGATPELLVRRRGDHMASRVLAGTIHRGENGAKDGALGQALLGSEKEQAEHAYAVNSVAQALAALCADLYVPETPSLLRLANVQHLATDVTGELVDGASALALAASLHPTAAVCGTPTERAFQMIAQLEGMDRGRYSGPVGWIDTNGDGDFGIALRSGQLTGPHDDAIRLFAGCGIVSGSDPAAEYAETLAKLKPMLDALTALEVPANK